MLYRALFCLIAVRNRGLRGHTHSAGSQSPQKSALSQHTEEAVKMRHSKIRGSLCMPRAQHRRPGLFFLNWVTYSKNHPWFLHGSRVAVPGSLHQKTSSAESCLLFRGFSSCVLSACRFGIVSILCIVRSVIFVRIAPKVQRYWVRMRGRRITHATRTSNTSVRWVFLRVFLAFFWVFMGFFGFFWVFWVFLFGTLDSCITGSGGWGVPKEADKTRLEWY